MLGVLATRRDSGFHDYPMTRRNADLPLRPRHKCRVVDTVPRVGDPVQPRRPLGIRLTGKQVAKAGFRQMPVGTTVVTLVRSPIEGVAVPDRSPSAVAPPGNVLAAVLTSRAPRRARSPVGTLLQSIDVTAATWADGSGRAEGMALFPVTALFGTVSVLPDGPEVEVASVGWEGVLGYPQTSSDLAGDTYVLCHIPGRVLTMPAEVLLEHLTGDARVRAVFDHYRAMSAALLSQRAACGQRHGAASRYATWLLQCADRLGTETSIPLTQAVLATTLGLQRTTVSTIATRLETQGLIQNRYGHVQILDPAGLQKAACACYPRFHARVDSLITHARAASR